MNDKFYVYEWYNVDTEEVFYVGKGSKKRKDQIKNRNKNFLTYIETHNVLSRIVKDNLTEMEAFKIEKELIEFYWNKG